MNQTPESLQAAQNFIEQHANQVLIQLGYQGEPAVHFGDAWAWSTGSQEIHINLDAFGDESYKPEWRILAFTHEVEAHHAPARREPASTEWDKRWSEEHPGGHFFLNVMADIAGNREIVSKVSGSQEGWRDFYAGKLFPTSDFRTKEDGQPVPRHIQFLYAALRETFVPEELCEVTTEVRTGLESLRDFQDSGQDLFAYATQPFKTKTEYLSRMEQMQLWRRGIWPKYLELYEQDAADPEMQQQNSDGSDQGEPSSSSGEGGQFTAEYEAYEEEHHPARGEEQDAEAIQQAQTAIDAILNRNPETADEATKAESQETDNEQKAAQASMPRKESAEQKRAAAMQASAAETAGVEVTDYQQYQRELQTMLPVIQDMRQVFEQFINERLTVKRQLLHRHSDGPVLDPDHLAQTMAQLKNPNVQNEDIPAFLEYGTKQTERELSGKLDFWLVVDNSPSMQGSKARMAARSAIAVLEGLDMFNELVKTESRQQGIDLDYDARTGVIVFNSNFTVPKPLGLSLSTQERIAATKDIQHVVGGTDTTPALDYILETYRTDPAADRKKVVVVLSDGEDPRASELANTIQALRTRGVLVYPIYLQSDVVDNQGVRIDNVADLPTVFAERVKDSLA